MDFNKARTFVEVVDRGGITAAAGYLQRTQQAISAQINYLESDLGIPLLVRRGPNINLTADGEQLYRLFKEHLVSIEAGIQQLKTDKSKASGVIRIGVWLEGSTHYLPQLIAEFNKQYPLVSFEIHTSTDKGLEEMLIANTIDISYQVFTENEQLLTKRPAFRETLVPVVSRAYVDKHGIPPSIEATLKVPIVDLFADYSTYKGWIRKNRPELLSEAQKKTMLVQVHNTIALKQMILKGLGLGFLALSAIQEELDSGDLIPISLPDETEPCWVEFDIVYKQQNSLGFIHQEFIKHAVKHWEASKPLAPRNRVAGLF